MADATAHYERREEELGEAVLREVERQVMLRIIDQRWREHLEEMDYLQERHQPAGDGPEGSARRVAARRLRDVRRHDEGHRPGLRAVRHARPGGAEQEARAARPPCRTCRRVRPTTPTTGGFDRAARPRPSAEGELPPRGCAAAAPPKQQTVVKDDFSKTPRNAPCPCGSGKKFKQCHGAGLRRGGRPNTTCATSPTTSATSGVASTRPTGYLKIADNRDRLAVLEAEVSDPALWDDQELAKKLNTEYANIRDDLDDVRRR